MVERYTNILLLLPWASSVLQYCYTRLSLIALNYLSAVQQVQEKAELLWPRSGGEDFGHALGRAVEQL